ncbi:hypothetical protein [Leifsonia virtsii]|uniref:Uncharacterized protein n=1 Tax=Leifsonia virtsii TaxID=3035915 RepID=A0ABT8J044_9MICO|nr:hypothetical protein [Leifsonia virtsii]MDN4598460.1 hypothetical protein [Leifsonia virtsii]
MAKKTIKAPVETFDGTVAGVRFENGVGHTDDENAIAYFERQGYDVSGSDKEQERPYPEGDPSDKWTKEQLVAYAKAHDVDLGKAKSKDEIWNAIQPGGTPYKGQTTPDGKALVNDSADPKDDTVKDQQSLPENAR